MPFKKGQSGNPGGRIGIPAEVRELARSHTAAAINRLVHWMNSNDARASVAACNSLLDRGYGKPVQAMEVSAPDEFEGMTETELRAYLKEQYKSLFGDGRAPTDCGQPGQEWRPSAAPSIKLEDQVHRR
jgi:hypothetical protein